jgi:hypothetical protein
MTLKPLFDCTVGMIDCERSDFDSTDLAMAIRETKRYLTHGQLSTIIVVRQRNGRWKVQTNIVTYLVAHCLGLLSIPAQELADVERTCP